MVADDFHRIRDSAEKAFSAGEMGCMLCARNARTQHTVPLFLRLPFLQGSHPCLFVSEFSFCSEGMSDKGG